MSENPFSAPAAASGGIAWADLNGRLLVIEPIEVETGIQTSFGATDAVRANVHVIDGEPEAYEDALIFPKILQSQTRSKIGEKVIGRLGTGTQKPGQSPPWVIQDATADDVALGVKWLEQRNTGSFAAPAPTQQAPAPQGPPAGQPPF